MTDEPAFTKATIDCGTNFIGWFFPVALIVSAIFFYALLGRLRRLPHAPPPNEWALSFLFAYCLTIPGLIYTYAITLSDKEAPILPNPDRSLRVMAWTGAVGALSTGCSVFTLTAFCASLTAGCRTAWLGWTSFGIGLLCTSLSFWWLRGQIKRLRACWQTAHLAQYQSMASPSNATSTPISPLFDAPFASSSTEHLLAFHPPTTTTVVAQPVAVRQSNIQRPFRALHHAFQQRPTDASI